MEEAMGIRAWLQMRCLCPSNAGGKIDHNRLEKWNHDNLIAKGVTRIGCILSKEIKD